MPIRRAHSAPHSAAPTPRAASNHFDTAAFFDGPLSPHAPGLAGMTVALAQCVMRLSEAIALYLAAAAPFGVAFFLRRRGRTMRARAFALSTLAGLAWPFTSLLLLARKGARAKATRDERHTDAAALLCEERAMRAVAASLAEVEAALAAAAGGTDTRARYALFAARRGVERFAGLARASRGVRPDSAPTERELELPRAAGRRGEDLLLAGRCAHRRNILRLLLHRERARGEMLHALAELRELAATLQDARPAAARQQADGVSAALTRAYELTLELLSNLDDERAATGVRRLLDAERARARRRQTRADGDARADGGQTCMTQAAVTASATSTPRPTGISSLD